MIILTGCLLLLPLASCKNRAQEKAAEPTAEQKKLIEAYAKQKVEARKVIVAKVNGMPITAYDLVDEMNTMLPEQPGNERKSKGDDKLRKEALERLIFRELALQYASKSGLKIPPDQVERELQRAKAELKTEEAYKQKLKFSAMTEEELKQRIEKRLIIDEITEREIFQKVHADPALTRKVYEKQKREYAARGLVTFEQARPEIEKDLMTVAVQKREDEWVNTLKKGARIEVLDKDAGNKIHGVSVPAESKGP